MRHGAMKDADWLLPWVNEIKVQTNDQLLLELGCGQGADSMTLTSHGFQVVSLDLDSSALGYCRKIKGCFPIQADLSATLPFSDNTFGFVLASLSLHYFSWDDTLSIVSELKRILGQEGMLLMRVNSIEDVNFGAGIGLEIEKNYFQNNGRMKRFFEEKDVRAALAGMSILEIRHDTIDRYGKDKQVWIAHAAA